jgi:chromosome segregation ATPase
MVDDKYLSFLEKLDRKMDKLNDRLDGIEQDLVFLKDQAITRQEALSMIETLEGISEAVAQQAATKAEDKADAIYEMLSSLIEGSNQRLLDRMDQQTKQVLNSLKPLDKILSLLVEKDERQDFALSTLEQRLRFLERRLGNEK